MTDDSKSGMGLIPFILAHSNAREKGGILKIQPFSVQDRLPDIVNKNV